MMQNNCITSLGGGKYRTENGIFDVLWDGEREITNMLVLAWQMQCLKTEPRLLDEDGFCNFKHTKSKMFNLVEHKVWANGKTWTNI